MMMYAAAGQCFCYLIITVLIRYNELPGYPASKQVASASVAFFFLYYIFFGIGFQGVPWLYPTEIVTLTLNLTLLENLVTNLIETEFPIHAYQRRSARDRLQLGLQLHGRRDHPNRHPVPAVEVLHHLDHLQRLLRPHRLPLLPRNLGPQTRGHRPHVPRKPERTKPPLSKTLMQSILTEWRTDLHLHRQSRHLLKTTACLHRARRARGSEE